MRTTLVRGAVASVAALTLVLAYDAATYAATGNNDVAEDSGVLVASVGDATSGGEGYQRGFNLGIHHFF